MSSEISSAASAANFSSTRTTLSEISEADSTLRVGLDLVSAARRNLSFLRAVSDSSHWLHHTPTLLEAIRRSKLQVFPSSFLKQSNQTDLVTFGL